MTTAVALRVASRYLAAAGQADLRKFQLLKVKADRELATLPRLFKTLDRQTYGYKSQDLVKAKATKAKLQAKIKVIRGLYENALALVHAFDRGYSPTTDLKRRIYGDDFPTWLKKYKTALAELGPGDDLLMLSTGMNGGGYVAEGENPLLDLQNAATSVAMFWDLLTRLDPDPVHIPEGASDEERLLAHITPSVRRLAKQTAAKLKKDKAAARALIWLVLEDVNASSASSHAEGLLSNAEAEAAADRVQKYVGVVAKALDHVVVDTGAFSVALLQEVGEAAAADRMTIMLADKFSPHLADAA